MTQSIVIFSLNTGPDMWDNWNDDRMDYVFNEVATDYNAGFTGAMAGKKIYMVYSMFRRACRKNIFKAN